MERKLKVGIVGASGWMAGALAAGVEYDQNGFDPETGIGTKSSISQVTALCDLNRELMEARCRELRLDQTECYDSFDRMLDSKNVEAVVVAVPNRLHADFAIKALDAGKHVFLEKPFATTLSDSQRLTAAAVRSDKTTKVDYILLHYDEQENLRRLIAQGAFGELASAFFTYRHPIEAGKTPEQAWKLSREKSGGAIPMGICHAIAATVYQIDADPVQVICKSSPAKIRNFDYPTQQDMLVTFANGVTAIIQGNIDFAEKYDARHTIIGTAGQFDYTPYNPLESRVMWSSGPLGRAYGPDAGFAHDHLDSGNVWKHQCGKTIRAFVGHALKGEKDPILGLESQTVRRIEAVIWAAEASAVNGAVSIEAGKYLV